MEVFSYPSELKKLIGELAKKASEPCYLLNPLDIVYMLNY
jgi:hypothetical protein